MTAQNDAATLSADVRNLTETNAAAAISSSGTLTISDPDSPATFVAQAGTIGSYGTFAIDQRRRLDLHRKLRPQRVRGRHHLHRHLPGRQRRRHPYLGDHQHPRQQRRRGADRPHHAGHVSREHGQCRRADHRCGRHLHRPRQQLQRRHADGRGPAWRRTRSRSATRAPARARSASPAATSASAARSSAASRAAPAARSPSPSTRRRRRQGSRR